MSFPDTLSLWTVKKCWIDKQRDPYWLNTKPQSKIYSARVCRAVVTAMAAQNMRLTISFEWWWSPEAAPNAPKWNIKADEAHTTMTRLYLQLSLCAHLPFTSSSHLTDDFWNALPANAHHMHLPPGALGVQLLSKASINEKVTWLFSTFHNVFMLLKDFIQPHGEYITTKPT